MNEIVLPRCTPEPLSAYLKALGILRLVAEQADPSAAGWWEGGVFHLETRLDEQGLQDFLLRDYSPTPIVAPWNSESGFHEGKRTECVDALAKSPDPRFECYRKTIKAVREWPELPPSGVPLGRMIEELQGEAAKKKGKSGDELRRLLADTLSALRRLEKVDPPLPAPPLEMTIEALRKALPKGAARDARPALSLAKKIQTQYQGLHRSAAKEHIIRAARNRLDDRAVAWLDAVVALGDGDTPFYPPLLGSGGNEGHLEYTYTFMSFLVRLLVQPSSTEATVQLLRNALFGDPTDDLVVAPVGQFDPGRAGGFNQGPSIENKDFPVNPWDFVLAMEGAVAWAGSIARRQGVDTGSTLCSPFTVAARPAGYVSASPGDQGKGRTAEVWVPLWSRPTGYPELQAFLSEGRAEVGNRRARHGLEFAEAAATLGVDRGVSEFVRYSLLKRRGKAYVALPVGHFPVEYRAEADLARELQTLMERLDRFLGAFSSSSQNKRPPARFESCRRGIDEALFAVLLRGGAPRVKELVAAVGRMERLLAQRDPTKEPRLARPLGGLSPDWLVAADDGSVEVRLAAALASIGATGQVGPLRANLAPVDPARPWLWAAGKAQKCWFGADLPARMAGALARRMMDAARFQCRTNPLYGALPIAAEDVAAFIEGEVDQALLEDLLYGFTWVRWADTAAVSRIRAKLGPRWATPVRRRLIPRSWALLRLLFLPGPLQGPGGTEIPLRPEPSIVPLLSAGRVGDAVAAAQRRLYSAGLAPVRARFADQADGLRIAASLLFPIRGVRRISQLVLSEASSR